MFNNFQQTFYCFSIPFKFISNNITLFLQFKREITRYFIKLKLIWISILECHGTFLKKKKKKEKKKNTQIEKLLKIDFIFSLPKFRRKNGLKSVLEML